MKKGKEKGQNVYAAKRFARGAMACPSCQSILKESSDRCPKCGFSGQMTMEKFPFAAPPLKAVVDPNKLLSKEETQSIVKKVEKLQKGLPQLRFVNCLVPMGGDVNLREFGFWLLNAAQLKEGEKAKSFAVLLLVDPKAKAVSVTTGYGLEPFVTDAEWVTLCEGPSDLFYRQKYGAGVEAFLDGAFDFLTERALEVRKEAKK